MCNPRCIPSLRPVCARCCGDQTVLTTWFSGQGHHSKPRGRTRQKRLTNRGPEVLVQNLRKNLRHPKSRKCNTAYLHLAFRRNSHIWGLRAHTLNPKVRTPNLKIRAQSCKPFASTRRKSECSEPCCCVRKSIFNGGCPWQLDGVHGTRLPEDKGHPAEATAVLYG